ncbi:MAG: uroporphyrinogen-III synthase [Burkholderiales bacterium]
MTHHPHAVVITRPLAQSAVLAQHVVALGRQAVVFPLLEICPLADSAPLREVLANLADYAMVAFVSPNAIDAAFAHLSTWPAGVAIAVMGEGSRAALARHGLTDSNATIFSPRNSERTDSETLLETLLETLNFNTLHSRKILIVRGESGRELLADQLRGHGLEVTQVAAYRRAAPEWNDARRQQLEALLECQNDWIVTSSEALHILVAMTGQMNSSGSVVKMQQQRMIVPHARIAETAHSLGFLDVVLTGSGDERLLAALQSKA